MYIYYILYIIYIFLHIRDILILSSVDCAAGIIHYFIENNVTISILTNNMTGNKMTALQNL